MAFAALLSLQAALAFGQTLEASVYDALRAKRPDLEWRLDRAQNVLYANGAAINLGNVKKEISSRGLQGEQAVGFAVATIAPNLDLMLAPGTGEPSWTEVKEHVLPAVAPVEYIGKTVCRPFSRLTATCIVIDSPTARSYVMKPQFEKWGISNDELEQAAMANMARIAKVGKIGFAVGDGKIGYAVINTGDSYDATRILLPTIQAAISKALGGTAFAAIPNRAFLIAWPSGSAVHAQIVDQVGRDFRTKSHALTDEIFVIDQRGVRLATDAEKQTGTIQDSR